MRIKRTSHIFFAVIFTAFLVTPTLLTIVGENIDETAFFSINEEESETEENDLRNLFELDETVHTYICISHTFDRLNKDNVHYLATFKELHLESIYPPPEHSI